MAETLTENLLSHNAVVGARSASSLLRARTLPVLVGALFEYLCSEGGAEHVQLGLVRTLFRGIRGMDLRDFPHGRNIFELGESFELSPSGDIQAPLKSSSPVAPQLGEGELACEISVALKVGEQSLGVITATKAHSFFTPSQRERVEFGMELFALALGRFHLMDVQKMANTDRDFQQQVFYTAIEEMGELSLTCHSDGRIIYASKSYRGVGKEPGRLIGLHLPVIFRPPYWSRVGKWVSEIFEHGSAPAIVVELDVPRFSSGTHRPTAGVCVEMKGVRIEIDGDCYLYVVSRDLTERLELRTALERSELLYRSVVDLAGEGIWLVDLAGNTIFANQRMRTLLGVEPAQFSEVKVSEVVTRELLDRAGLCTESPRYYETFQEESRLRSPSGTPLWVVAHVRAIPVGLDRPAVMFMFTDITARKTLEVELDTATHHDQMTGLANRAGMDRFVRVLEHRRTGEGLTVFFVDLDDFKGVNDRHGYRCGDEILTQTADRLRNVARPADLVSRVRGDEFVLISPGISDHKEVARYAARLRSCFQAPYFIGGEVVTVGACIGFSTSLSGGDVSATISEADRQMSRLKADSQRI